MISIYYLYFIDYINNPFVIKIHSLLQGKIFLVMVLLYQVTIENLRLAQQENEPRNMEYCLVMISSFGHVKKKKINQQA